MRKKGKVIFLYWTQPSIKWQTRLDFLVTTNKGKSRSTDGSLLVSESEIEKMIESGKLIRLCKPINLKHIPNPIFRIYIDGPEKIKVWVDDRERPRRADEEKHIVWEGYLFPKRINPS